MARGTVLHCSRFGAVVRLEDGRLALLPSDEPGYPVVKRAVTAGNRPEFTFLVTEEGRRLRIVLADRDVRKEEEQRQPQAGAAASLEQKIIDYLRQTAEWDPRAAISEDPRGAERPRANRLLPFEARARRQYRDSPERPRRPKR
jgi:hypothetical protein